MSHGSWMGRRRIHSTHLPANYLKLAMPGRCRAEELHLSALGLTQLSLEEANVQMALYYYYLGLHYQATEQPKKAEMMLLKAIQINDTVVGLESFQVIFKYKIVHISLYKFLFPRLLSQSVFSLSL